MLDQKRERVWFTSTVRPAQPARMPRGFEPSVRRSLFPIERSTRHLSMYDPATKTLTHIDTCFATHHLIFAEDANHTLWTSSGGKATVIGWLEHEDVRRDA